MTKEILKMSEKEAHRLGIMKMLVKKDLTFRSACEKLGLPLSQSVLTGQGCKESWSFFCQFN